MSSYIKPGINMDSDIKYFNRSSLLAITFIVNFRSDPSYSCILDSSMTSIDYMDCSHESVIITRVVRYIDEGTRLRRHNIPLKSE